MAVGEGSLESYASYIALGRETTFGTYTTATAGLDFLSASLKLTLEDKILEQVETSRTFSKQVRMSRVVEGEIETYAYPRSTAFNYLVAGGFGGSVTSATATGETAGGTAITHTYPIGDMVSNSFTSLNINERKGNSSGAQIFEYSGMRVNEINFSAEIDDPLKLTLAVMGKDVTTTSNDVSAALTTTGFNCLNFSDGIISVVADSLGAATTTAFFHVQSTEFGIANNLKSDSGSRRIGSETLDVLPPGIANVSFQATLRFDTSTAYDAMLANTTFAARLTFNGPTLGTSIIRESLVVEMPILKIKEAGLPEIGGPDEMLTSTIVFSVLRDDSSVGGFAMRALVTNDTANYNT